MIVPPSFDTVHHFLSQITNFVVTVCSTNVYILLFCLTCRTLHVDINRGVKALLHGKASIAILVSCNFLYHGPCVGGWQHLKKKEKKRSNIGSCPQVHVVIFSQNNYSSSNPEICIF